MSERTMDERVTELEKLAVTLSPLPARMGAVEGRLETVELQILQLGSAMTGEFSAVRREMAEMKTELRDDIAAQGRELAAHVLDLRGEMRRASQKILDKLNER